MYAMTKAFREQLASYMILNRDATQYLVRHSSDSLMYTANGEFNGHIECERWEKSILASECTILTTPPDIQPLQSIPRCLSMTSNVGTLLSPFCKSVLQSSRACTLASRKRTMTAKF
eukprot:scaffold1126_cov179-Ochromonas_danica.AAC.2